MSDEWIPQVKFLSVSGSITPGVPAITPVPVPTLSVPVRPKKRVNPEALMPYFVLAAIAGEAAGGKKELEEWEAGVIRDEPAYEGHRDYIVEKLAEMATAKGDEIYALVDKLLQNVAAWASKTL